MKKVAAIVSVIAIVISVVSICLVIFRIEPITYDWMGILVGVLSILVMILIGFQIHNVIDFKESVKEVKSLKTDIKILEYSIKEDMKTIHLLTNHNISKIYYMLSTKDYRNIQYEYLYYSLVSIMYASDIRDIATCNSIVKVMLEVIVSPENVKLSKEQKNTIFNFVSNVKHGNEIERYNELLQVLARIGV